MNEQAECTGVSAVWCPIHGDCTCKDREDQNDEECPLHGLPSTHAVTPLRPACPSCGCVRYREYGPCEGSKKPLQARVFPWLIECFGPVIASDPVERNHRFLEESLELVQALGCTKDEAHQLVDYVFGRPQGEPTQEVGGVMITLAALCLANTLDMDLAGEKELERIWTKVEQIRAKQAAKPSHSPLPE